jgi:hypothetical protein
MSAAGRGAALPLDSEPTVDAITWAYVEAADGDALAALRLAVADALLAPTGGAHGLAWVHQGRRW